MGAEIVKVERPGVILREDLPFQIGVIGCGKRVLSHVIPAIESLGHRTNLAWLVARSQRYVTSNGRRYLTKTIGALDQEDMDSVDLVFISVPEQSVNGVVTSLRQYNAKHCHLLVDTPAKASEDLGSNFLSVSIAEDSAWLPWIDPLREALREEGGLYKAISLRALYRYHGVSVVRALIDCESLPGVQANRSRFSFGPLKHISFNGVSSLTMVEPTRYPKGKLLVMARSGVFFSSMAIPGTVEIAIDREGGSAVGFTVASVSARLTDEERFLSRNISPSDNVVSAMSKLKSVAVARMIRDLAEGRPGYPVECAYNDFLASTKYRD